MSYSIGLVGAGAMGGAIGTRLLQKGHDLIVFDLDREKVEALVSKGARAAASAADAAQNVSHVITSLNAARIVDLAIFAETGIASGAATGTTLIDMSSIEPDATRDFARRAYDLGLGWVDSPLSGGAPKALDGTLTLMLGGREDDVVKAKPILGDLATTLTHMGPAGAGQTTKMINQVLCGLGFMAVAEATQLAIDAGVDAAKIPDALRGGRADSALLQEYMPRFATRDYRRTGRIDNMVKDLNMVAELARKTGTSMPMTALCAEIHRMLTAAGLGGEDQAAVMEFFKGAKGEFPA
ncbi:MAG: NAD(P)-dependent oxidoreductase [Pseudomonadota bacterium]